MLNRRKRERTDAKGDHRDGKDTWTECPSNHCLAGLQVLHGQRRSFGRQPHRRIRQVERVAASDASVTVDRALMALLPSAPSESNTAQSC
jgi:hypothetical protein